MTSQDIENEIAALQAALESESSPLRQIAHERLIKLLNFQLEKVVKYEAKQRLLQEKQKQTKLL